MSLKKTKDPLRFSKGIVYRIYNKIDNKSYIGKAKRSFYHRYLNGEWWIHSHCVNLKQDVLRLGIDAFEVSILTSGHTEDELYELEALAILEHNALLPFGYNVVAKGRIQTKISEETRKKLSEALKKRRAHPDYIPPNRWKYPTQRELQRTIMTGRKTSSQTRKKQSDAGKRRTDSLKPVYQFNKNNGQLVSSFSSLSEAQSITGISKSDISYSASSVQMLTAGGYIWRYSSAPIIIPNRVKSKLRKIAQIDPISKQTVCVFASANLAAASVGGQRSKILEVCKGNRLTHNNFTWKYYDEIT